ncbi:MULTISPECIES: AAA family ATPase [Glycomyces]|uniref:AAA family ATPase n=2 Tax=Glycomyces TaxID=58113 RepID=A0A9X3PLX4_9ACTN|nr:AAA family ATPase [Glycomyces lechevalierae]MDA1386359.1 AAA family ATPase [Glycomyces lechevalierae]MDR7338875.1 RecA-family ATPase [Glycomyces lechevalierae]
MSQIIEQRRQRFRRWTWDEIEAEREARPVWVIDGLISDGTTSISGRSEAGKSMLCAALTFSLATGRPFLGRKPNRMYRPAIIGTDDRAHLEYTERLARIGPGAAESVRDNLNVFTAEGLLQYEDWRDLFEAVMESGSDFVIVDNVTQMIEDENSGADVNRTFAGVRLFTQAGIPVVVVNHHSQKVNTTASVANRGPSGSSNLVRHVRHRLTLAKDREGSGRTLFVDGNYAEGEQLKLEMPRGIDRPVYKVLTAPQQRKPETLDQNRELANWIKANCRSVNKTQQAENAAKHFGLNKATVYDKLKPGGPVARLLDAN